MKIQITGKVVRGDGYGRQLGFPTANLDRRQYVRDRIKIKLGVWAGKAKLQIADLRLQIGMHAKSKIINLKSKIYPAAIVIGPIDKTGLPKIEAHLIGFKGNLYGKRITLTLNRYIRPFKKFKNQTELVKAIKADVIKVKQYA